LPGVHRAVPSPPLDKSLQLFVCQSSALRQTVREFNIPALWCQKRRRIGKARKSRFFKDLCALCDCVSPPLFVMRNARYVN
jgi:hypothetical protein